MKRTFSDVTRAFQKDTGVEMGRMFGAPGLKVRGRVFAMEVKGALVVRLDAARCQDLVAAGCAVPFDPGHGRPMKAWVAISKDVDQDWVALAKEARTLVARMAKPPQKT